jgi:CHAD domain-containing protein
MIRKTQARPSEAARDEAVHQARKRLKQLRAALRLGRDALDFDWRSEERRLRAVARPLSQARDARVMVDCLDKLQQAYASELSSSTLRGLHAALETRRRSVASAALEHHAALSRAEAAIAQTQARLEAASALSQAWEALEPGLRRTYRAGRRDMALAVEEPDVERLHAWRKQAKYLRHQLEQLTPAWPATLKPLAAQAKALGDRLGDDHDLAVLACLLRTGCREALPAPERRLVLALIAERRAGLQQEAFRLGRALYAERPRDFAARLGAHWKPAGTLAG